MGKMELEVKILNINKEKFIDKIIELGAKLKEETNQYLYTYDLPTLYSRYIDILDQLNNPESDIKYDVAVEKYKLLAFEIDNLLTKEDKDNLKEMIGFSNLEKLLESEKLVEILNKKELKDYLRKFRNNSKKWIRIRKAKNKTTIAVKHILADNETNIQQMLETEIIVESLEDAKELLKALGYSHKSYQEKRRITYVLDNHDIDIDTWPGIPTYFELEGESKEDLENMLAKLGYKMADAVSCSADEVYNKYGKSMFDCRELKF